MFFRRGSYKVYSMVVSVINQVLFMLLYVIPSTPIDASVKRIVFIVFITLAYAGLYIGNPKISVWRYSLVEPNKRGRYNAVMQMISLLMGSVFAFAMGAIVDKFKTEGDLYGAFTVCAITIFVLMVIHSLTIILVVDKKMEADGEEKKENVFKSIIGVASNKKVLLLAGLFVIYNAANCAAVPFYSTFMIGELQMDQVEAQIINAVIASGIQFAIALPLGMIADKYSFPKMLMLCLISMTLRTLFIVFANPENGFWCFVLFRLFDAAVQVGAPGAMINMVINEVPENRSADALAFCQSVGGITGFGCTLLMSSLVNKIQQDGNMFFGMNVYAQQVVSVIASLITVVACVYLWLGFFERKKKNVSK